MAFSFIPTVRRYRYRFMTYYLHKVYFYVKTKFSVTAKLSDQDQDPAWIRIGLTPWIWIQIRNETNPDPQR